LQIKVFVGAFFTSWSILFWNQRKNVIILIPNMTYIREEEKSVSYKDQLKLSKFIQLFIFRSFPWVLRVIIQKTSCLKFPWNMKIYAVIYWLKIWYSMPTCIRIHCGSVVRH
jgi:hypothetical protein